MFSFHKPKIYRSLQGCCICRAKSSSSRFTDSTRYEKDFDKCFEISDIRSGEICNACVLLVKRWKKLPAGSTRNWRHVVDARAGPGTKSMNKIKNKAAGILKQDPLKEERFKKKHKHNKKKVGRPSLNSSALEKPASPSTFSDDIGDDCMSEDHYSEYLSNSDASDDESSSTSNSQVVSERRKEPQPSATLSFLDLTYWKRTETCCGIIFKGINGEVLIDPSLMHPCRSCKVTQRHELSDCDSCQSDSYSSTSERRTSPLSRRPRGGSACTEPPAPMEGCAVGHDRPALSPEPTQTPIYTDCTYNYNKTKTAV